MQETDEQSEGKEKREKKGERRRETGERDVRGERRRIVGAQAAREGARALVCCYSLGVCLFCVIARCKRGVMAAFFFFFKVYGQLVVSPQADHL